MPQKPIRVWERLCSFKSGQYGALGCAPWVIFRCSRLASAMAIVVLLLKNVIHIFKIAVAPKVPLSSDHGAHFRKTYCAIPSWFRIKPYSSAVWRWRIKRPDFPPCPASIFTLNSKGFWSVFMARSFATHLAGS